MRSKKIIIMVCIVAQSHCWGAALTDQRNKQLIRTTLTSCSLKDTLESIPETLTTLNQNSTPPELAFEFIAAILRDDQSTIDRCLQSDTLDINFADSRWEFFTPLLLATQKRAIVTVQKILQQKKIDPNKPSQWGDTPLAEAARLGYAEIAYLLLEAGATVDLQYPQHGRRSALWEAISNRHALTAKLLIEHGATVLSTMHNQLQLLGMQS